MAITTDVTTNLGKLRFVVGDDSETVGAGAKPDGSNIPDEQLQVVLDQYSHWQDAVPPVLRVLANLYAREARHTKIADYSEDMRQVSKELRMQAEAWDRNPPTTVDVADMVSGITGATGSITDSPIPFGWRLFSPRINDQRSE